MDENDLYMVCVSSLVIKKDIKKDSKIYLKKNTIVKYLGNYKFLNKQQWINVMTVDRPVVSGYVNKNYLIKIKKEVTL